MHDSIGGTQPQPLPTAASSTALSNGTTVLWLLTATLVAADIALSVAGFPIVSSVFGGAALISLIAALVHHFRRKRS